MEVIQTLVLCEKPTAAALVARVLDEDGDPRTIETQGVRYFEARRRHDTILVCSALGHLYALTSKGHSNRRYYPVWDSDWKPKHLIDKKSGRLQAWISVINRLSKQADRYVNACDYDNEGSLIGYTVLRYAGDNAHEKALRMKFSTMTERDLLAAYKNLIPSLDFSQVDAGRCRHELDWAYGINLSRLLTESAVNQSFGYATLSTGRVQGPTLRFVVDREEEIECFVPTPFWTINARVRHGEQLYQIGFEQDRIAKLADARKIVEACKNCVLRVKQKESVDVEVPAPYPFDLSTLQSEAYRQFGLTPSRTLSAAEGLYLQALISYPRTSSQKLPPDIGYGEILRGIGTMPEYRGLAATLTSQPILRPRDGPKDDSAHPAIFPTGEPTRKWLARDEANVLDLIIRRFMATFATSSLSEHTRLTLSKEPHSFFIKGSRLIREGWIKYYGNYARHYSHSLPPLSEGDRIAIETIEAVSKLTQSPDRYSPASLLLKMESENIGTKATRAETIETLYNRDYIKDRRIRPTPLARELVSVLDKYCPLVIDPSFTGQIENHLDGIRTQEISRARVVIEAVDHLRPIISQLAANEDEIGEQLSQIIRVQKLSKITLVEPCPSCNSKLVIVRSRASGKRFIGCTAYDKGCRFTLPLPQYGALTIVKEKCKVCGFQLVQTRTRYGKALISCSRCYSTNTQARSKAPRRAAVSHLNERRLSRIRRKVRVAKNINATKEATKAIAMGS